MPTNGEHTYLDLQCEHIKGSFTLLDKEINMTNVRANSCAEGTSEPPL